MFSNYPKNYLLIALLIFIGFKGFSQLSKTHYIPPLTNADSGSSTPGNQYIYLSTPNNSDVAYTITPIGQPPSSIITGVVSKANPREISVGSGSGQLFIPVSLTSRVTNNRGYIIEAEDVIYVSVRMQAGGGATPSQAGALVSKGISALDTTFRIGSYTNENPQDNYLSFISVMATEDNTIVNFSDIPTDINLSAYTGPIPFSTTLNKGESYTVAINSNQQTIANRDGLIGALVTSDKNIVVNCGSANGSFGTGNARDYGIDQIVGLSKIGREYIFVKGEGDNQWENALIIAHVDNTSIFVNGNTTPIATINSGEYFRVLGNNYNANGNMYVETSQDVFAYQGVGGLNNGGTPSEANQGMFFVPPLSCEARGNIDNIAFIENIGNISYLGGVTIVTKVGATVTVTNQTQTFPLGSASPVTGKTDYITYKLTNLSGNVTVTGDDELYCAYFNYNGAATSGSFYSGFPSPPEINFDAQFVTLGNCIPNVTLSAANTSSFDTFEWFFDDGTGFVTTGINTPDITPTIPGRYKLIGEITCSGLILESVEVPVSLCPDDRDNDGIIDNIDIDNDNDGILNCTESRGDVVLDLADMRPPVLRFQDGTSNSTIATNNIVTNNTGGGTNTVRLTSTGDFESFIPQDSNANNTYNIVFTEPVNFKFSENTTVTHTSVNGEFFIAKILPANKNITLVDPDDRLLVDTNFDGVFETGVTIASGSEIHFRINPSATGTTPYQFFANQVDGFSFIHNLSNTAQSSTFNGNISLTCFKNDNDGDGIKDEFDLDSDNDGIPDRIENSGLDTPLSLNDVDLNGLDDTYNINATPIDTDNDGVLDFYDLDSDNDGITDLMESGEPTIITADTDLNGIIDNSFTFGSNGWFDDAETAPDSNIINYTVNDLDLDLIFSYIDSDSDDDSCTDVIEAGFSDTNMDTYLGDGAVTVNINGIVTSASDGYTVPNTDYAITAVIEITTQPEDTTVCLASNTTISITITDFNFIQWEVSTDGTNWNTIIDNSIYSNSQTTDLTITSAPASINNYKYRALININGNSCDFYSDEANLTVNDLPIANNPNLYTQCDDDSNDGQAFFNLTLDNIKEEINPNYLAENLVFTYFDDINEANTNGTSIPDPSNYQDALGFTTETVYVRVENPNGCSRVVPLDLAVSPSSGDLRLYSPNSIYQCDDGTDVRDGVSTFDMSNIRDQISNVIFSSFNVSVHFYESQTDAELENNEIIDISNHQNTNSPNMQSIWVRVKSDLGNDCLGLEEFTNLLIVEALPTANPVSIPRACDFNTNDTIVSFPFNTSTLEADILNGQNPANVTITYSDSNGDPLLYSDGRQVTSPIENIFLTENQTITITVTNNVTLDPDGPCSDSTTLDFIIDERPVINPVIIAPICDGSAGDIDDDGLYPFDLSNVASTILGTQTNMDIFFNYTDDSGMQISNATALPATLISGNQTITIDVINPLNTNCSVSTNIDLIVNPLPDFSVESPRIVCTSDPTFSVDLDVTKARVIDTFDYEWRFTSSDGSITDEFVSNAENITVSTPGTYFITLTKTDGTGCARTREIIVDASETATITQEDITIVDISKNNTVTINTATLGSGNYEYALRELGSPFINYQEEPFFENVSPGFYTVYVNDEICGVATIDISVIGAAKYFTPNGDGDNDYWLIKGINASIQPNSNIVIFDRYGKLLKQISPLSPGWDGTIGGQNMPSDDYWFRVLLQDGREFMGHFTLKR